MATELSDPQNLQLQQSLSRLALIMHVSNDPEERDSAARNLIDAYTAYAGEGKRGQITDAINKLRNPAITEEEALRAGKLLKDTVVPSGAASSSEPANQDLQKSIPIALRPYNAAMNVHAGNLRDEAMTLNRRDVSDEQRNASLDRVTDTLVASAGEDQRANIRRNLEIYSNPNSSARDRLVAGMDLQQYERTKSTSDMSHDERLAQAMLGGINKKTDNVYNQEYLKDPNNYTGPDARGVPLTSAVAEMLKSSDVVQVGDSYHKNNQQLMEWLGNPQTASQLKSAGFERVGMELDKSAQPILDTYANKEITEEEFKRRLAAAGEVNGWRADKEKSLSETAAIVRNLTDAGIRVEAKDPNSGGQSLTQHRIMSDLDRPMEERIAAAGQFVEAKTQEDGPEVRQAARDYANATLDPMAMPEARAAAFEIMDSHDKRALDDRELAASLQKNTLLVYGAGHGRHSNGTDLDDAFEARGMKMGRINVAPYHKVIESLEIGNEINVEDQPEARYVLGETDLNQGSLGYTVNTPASLKEKWDQYPIAEPIASKLKPVERFDANDISQQLQGDSPVVQSAEAPSAESADATQPVAQPPAAPVATAPAVEAAPKSPVKSGPARAPVNFSDVESSSSSGPAGGLIPNDRPLTRTFNVVAPPTAKPAPAAAPVAQSAPAAAASAEEISPPNPDALRQQLRGLPADERMMPETASLHPWAQQDRPDHIERFNTQHRELGHEGTAIAEANTAEIRAAETAKAQQALAVAPAVEVASTPDREPPRSAPAIAAPGL